MNIVITGPQASGKGTQAKMLEEKLGLFRVSMGEIFRKIAKENTDLGRRVNEYINQKGSLVPDEITTRIIRDFLISKNLTKGMIFEGFPRTMGQLEVLKKLLTEKGAKLDRAIYIKVGEKEALRRLSGRLVCSKCGENFNILTKPPKKKEICDICQGKLVRREDETPQVIEERLRNYYKETEPLLNLYRKMGILEKVDGERPIEVIFEDILGKLKNLGLAK